jgi:hypothetical protein
MRAQQDTTRGVIIRRGEGGEGGGILVIQQPTRGQRHFQFKGEWCSGEGLRGRAGPWDLFGEPGDGADGKAAELVLFQQLVEVNGENLRRLYLCP